MTPLTRLIAISSATALLSFAAGCGEPRDSAGGEPPATATSEPTSSPPETAATGPARPPTATKKPRPPAADNELGLPHEVIVRLGRTADVFGYGLGPGTALDYEQATNFAYAVSTVCDGWRSGDLTFQDSVDEDVMSGAPPADARGFNRFLESDFCPAYYRAGN